MVNDKLPKYEIITKKQVFAEDRDFENENYIDELTEEQDALLAKMGYQYNDDYIIHFFDSAYTCHDVMITDIRDALQGLAIKDGADLVKYDNNNIGFVAYYNGIKNGFEIIET